MLARAAQLSGLSWSRAAASSQGFRGFSEAAQEAVPSADTAPAARTLADFTVYKSKAALRFRPLPASWVKRALSNGAELYSVDKAGVLMMEFAAVKAAQGSPSTSGFRSYDWEHKASFALSVVELATLCDWDYSHGRKEAPAAKDMVFYHDPDKGSDNEGTRSKQLRVVAGMSGDGGILLTLTSGGKGDAPRSSISVPMSRPEYLVIKHLASSCTSALLGWDKAMM